MAEEAGVARNARHSTTSSPNGTGRRTCMSFLRLRGGAGGGGAAPERIWDLDPAPNRDAHPVALERGGGLSLFRALAGRAGRNSFRWQRPRQAILMCSQAGGAAVIPAGEPRRPCSPRPDGARGTVRTFSETWLGLGRRWARVAKAGCAARRPQTPAPRDASRGAGSRAAPRRDGVCLAWIIHEPAACERDLPVIRCVAGSVRSSTCLQTRLRCGPILRLAAGRHLAFSARGS